MRATEHRTENKGHGRIEKRSCRVLDLTDHPDKAPLPHRTVAFRIERERRNKKTGKIEHETSSAGAPDPAQIRSDPQRPPDPARRLNLVHHPASVDPHRENGSSNAITSPIRTWAVRTAYRWTRTSS